MRCKFCGCENPANARNCSNCGEIIESGETNIPPSNDNQSNSNPVQPLQPNNERERVKALLLIDPAGQVYGFSQQEEFVRNYKKLVWKFRVHVFAQDGSVNHRLLVEMRGDGFSGIINDGDVVKLPGRWRVNEVITPDALINTTLRIIVCPDRRASRLAGIEKQSVLNPVGQVNGFSQLTEVQTSYFRQVQEQRLVWRFRVGTFDAAGNQIYRIPVEVRGKLFTGAINNGDTVKLSGRWNSGEVFRPKEILNQTLGVQIRTSLRTSWGGTFAAGIFIFIILMFLFRVLLGNGFSFIAMIIALLVTLLTTVGIKFLVRTFRRQ